MTKCAIKVCRNYKARLKTPKNITYHRIPTDPILRSRWVDIIRKSRGEDNWKPAKTSTVCSDHFHAKDRNSLTPQGRLRLRKGAVPCKALFLSSVQSDQSEGSDEDPGVVSDDKAVKDIFEDSNSSISDENKTLSTDDQRSASSIKASEVTASIKTVYCSVFDDNKPSSTIMDVHPSASSINASKVAATIKKENSSVSDENKPSSIIIDVHPSASSVSASEVAASIKTENYSRDENKSSSITTELLPSTSNINACKVAAWFKTEVISSDSTLTPDEVPDSKITEVLPENKTETYYDSSDIDSVYDSPGKAKMRKELRRRITLQKKHVLKIKSLKQKNRRLQKKICYLKQIIETLKKQRNS